MLGPCLRKHCVCSSAKCQVPASHILFCDVKGGGAGGGDSAFCPASENGLVNSSTVSQTSPGPSGPLRAGPGVFHFQGSNSAQSDPRCRQGPGGPRVSWFSLLSESCLLTKFCIAVPKTENQTTSLIPTRTKTNKRKSKNLHHDKHM